MYLHLDVPWLMAMVWKVLRKKTVAAILRLLIVDLRAFPGGRRNSSVIINMHVYVVRVRQLELYCYSK